MLVNNAYWTAGTSVLDFLRDVGKHITVNQTMAKESVRNRLVSEVGISFTEFSYMLLQANDFRHLYSAHNVELQMGGSDGGDPTQASAAALAAVAREVPTETLTRADLTDTVTVLVQTGLASSNSDARRTMAGHGYKVNGVVVDESTDLAVTPALDDRYLLLQKGKKHHRVIDLAS